jgi:hypothetical protein
VLPEPQALPEREQEWKPESLAPPEEPSAVLPKRRVRHERQMRE